jgi:hypothetical protein
MCNMSLGVNGQKWTTIDRRKEIPCAVCGTPTKGRMGAKPICMDHGIAAVMKPIGAASAQLREMLERSA